MNARGAILDALRTTAKKSPQCAAEVSKILSQSQIGAAILAGDIEGAANGIAQIATGGSIPTGRKALDAPLYDSDYLGTSGKQSLNFFTSLTYQANGSTGGTFSGTQKRLAATNMDAQGVIVAPKSHQAFGLMVEVLPDLVTGQLPSVGDILMLRQTLYLQIHQGKRLVRSIDFAWTSGPGAVAYGNAGSFAELFYSGDSSPRDYARFGPPSEPIKNRPDEPFRLEVLTAPEYNVEQAPLLRLSLMGVEVTTQG